MEYCLGDADGSATMWTADPNTDVDGDGALDAVGLDFDGDGVLDDARGKPARFSILTMKGTTVRERTLAVIQDQLRQVGLQVDAVPMERNQMLAQWAKGDYDAIYFSVESDAFDPARNLEFWMSSGSAHFWNPEQVKPATTWEAQIDALMRKQSTTTDSAERRRLFKTVQTVFAEHVPLIYFAAGKATIAMSGRVHGATPSVLPPSVLWNAEVLSVDPPRR